MIWKTTEMYMFELYLYLKIYFKGKYNYKWSTELLMYFLVQIIHSSIHLTLEPTSWLLLGISKFKIPIPIPTMKWTYILRYKMTEIQNDKIFSYLFCMFSSFCIEFEIVMMKTVWVYSDRQKLTDKAIGISVQKIS